MPIRRSIDFEQSDCRFLDGTNIFPCYFCLNLESFGNGLLEFRPAGVEGVVSHASIRLSRSLKPFASIDRFGKCLCSVFSPRFELHRVFRSKNDSISIASLEGRKPVPNRLYYHTGGFSSCRRKLVCLARSRSLSCCWPRLFITIIRALS